MSVDYRLCRLHITAVADRLVVEHGAFGDAEKIARLAEFIERAPLRKMAALRDCLVEELRARAAFSAAACGRDRIGV